MGCMHGWMDIRRGGPGSGGDETRVCIIIIISFTVDIHPQVRVIIV